MKIFPHPAAVTCYNAQETASAKPQNWVRRNHLKTPQLPFRLPLLILTAAMVAGCPPFPFPKDVDLMPIDFLSGQAKRFVA